MSDQHLVSRASNSLLFSGTICAAYSPYEYVSHYNNPLTSVICEYCKTKYIVKDHNDFRCPYCSAPNRGISTYR